MSLLLKVPRLVRRKPRVHCEPVGTATVVFEADGMTVQAGRLAMSLPPDHEHTLVLVDVPAARRSTALWETLAVAVEAAGKPLRLLPSEAAGEIDLESSAWLSNRLGQSVLYPDGQVLSSANGLVFLPPDGSRGWVACAPGKKPSRVGRRFPVPDWEGLIAADSYRVGRSTTAEPLPAGVWLRPDGPEPWLEAGRAKLTRWLCVRSRELTVVLGGHGIPALPLADVVQWWAALSPDLRAGVRFLCYGAIGAPAGEEPGQALADALGVGVVCHGGFPVGSPDCPDVFTMLRDGSHGVRTFAEQLTFRPRRGKAAEPDAPQLRRWRRPPGELTEVGPGLYRHRSEALVEVVQAGLWLRSAREHARAGEIRRMAPDPGGVLVFHDPEEEAVTTLVAEILHRQESSLRERTIPVPLPSPSRTQRRQAFAPDLTTPLSPLPRLSRLLRRHDEQTVASPPSAVAAIPSQTDLRARLEPDGERTTRLEHPAKTMPEVELETGSPILQPEPPPESRAWPLAPDFEAHGSVVRENREDEFDALAERMTKVLRRFSAHPRTSESGLIEAVAAGLYLARHDPDVDGGLRAGTDGTHVSFARCAAAGLHKMPVHRNAAAITAVDPGPRVWKLLKTLPVVRDWGFSHLLTAPTEDETGTADLVVWSLTGRLTAPIEPADDAVTGRVVFLPGTAFKVLDVVEPGEGDRGVILMRELADVELGGDGKGTGGKARDDLVRSSLRKLAKRTGGRGSTVPIAHRHRFSRVPGFAEVPDHRDDERMAR
ncbi:hypothetical protein GCM10027598_58850 [Amycolatopsis oliviviridis]|uniref:Uncharacterized protein n=1 Tax=Amycolatopsis oliviviridis TaxID=1471590 RepID=A0ABQ3LXU0_9PSEU|nr:hypothetical protein [Amycolatopsis oliviviridis]GHH28521.1 hypothetical protein GCM10017790_59500 [Amycolatopsis oliviviridis]